MIVICHVWYPYMTLTPAERQARRREKLRAKGRVLFQAWVTPAQAKRIKALLDGADVTYHAPAPRRRKRLRLADPVAEKNLQIYEARHAEIHLRLRAGEKPRRIAAWLNTLGFAGTGATLNTFLKLS